MTRKEFLKNLLRGFALGGLALAVVRLGRRKQIDLSCINKSYCPPCSIKGSCNLPQALSYRKSLEKRGLGT